MNHCLLKIILLSLTFSISFAAPIYEERSATSILITRPIDAGISNEPIKNYWFTALLDSYIRFRIAPIKKLNTISFEQITQSHPSWVNLDKAADEMQLSKVWAKIGVTHLLNHKYEINYKEHTITYYLEVVNFSNKKLVFSKETSMPLDKFSTHIDSILHTAVTTMGIESSPEIARFFSIPVISENYKHFRSLGELLSRDKFSNDSKQIAISALDYEKIIEKDPFLLLANYICSHKYYIEKNYIKSAKYLKELLDITPIYSDLYLTLARSYRLSGNYNDALSIIKKCESRQLKSVPFLVEKAQSLEKMGQSSYALNLYSQVLSLDSLNQIALAHFARTKNKEGNFKEAQVHALKLIGVAPQDPVGPLQFAIALLGLSKDNEALEQLRNAYTLDSTDVELLEILGDLNMKLQRFQNASDNYTKVLSIRPDFLPLYLKKARALESSRLLPEALHTLLSIEKKFPNNLDLQKFTGILFFKNNQVDSSLKRLHMYLKNRPDDPDVLTILGEINLKVSNFDAAINFFNRALLKALDKSMIKLALAKTYLQNSDAENAMKLMRDVLAEKPIKGTHSLMADILLSKNDTANALSHYHKERNLHGENEHTQLMIARIQFNRGILELAKAEFLRLIKIDPINSNAYFYLGIICISSGKIVEGENYLSEAMKLSDNNGTFFVEIGDAFEKSDNLNKAIIYYKKSLELDSKNPITLVKLANAQHSANLNSEAAQTMLSLYQIDKTSYAEYLAKAGHLLLNLGDTTKSKEMFTLYLTNHNKNTRVSVNLAEIYYNEKEYSKVINLLEPISNSNKTGKNEFNYILADAYYRTNQAQKSIPLLKSLLEQNSNNKNCLELYALSSEKIGDLTTAATMYFTLIELGTVSKYPEYTFHLGNIYENSNELDLAKKIYARAIEFIPYDKRSYERLGSIYHKEKEISTSLDIFKKAATKFPGETSIIRGLAESYISAQDTLNALVTFENLLKIDSTDSISWEKLGNLYYFTKRFKDAITPLERATQYFKQNTELLYKLCSAYVSLQSFDKAEVILDIANSIIKTDQQLLELAADIYRNKKNYNKLKIILQQLILQSPKNIDILIELSSMHIEDNDRNLAQPLLKSAISLDSNNSQAHYLLALTYQNSNNDSLLLFHLLKSIEYNSKNWKSQFELSKYYLSKNDTKSAELFLQNTIALNPQIGKAHFEYGLILLNRNDIDLAYAEFNTASQLENNSPLYKVVYGYSLASLNKFNQAKEIADTVSAKFAGSPEVLFWSGMIYKKVGDIEKAMNFFKNAISKSSKNPLFHESLGDIFLEKYNFKAAAQSYLQAWECSNFNERRALKLGKTMLYDKKFLESKGIFETILSHNANHDEARFYLITAQCSSEDLKNAKKSLALFSSPKSSYKHLAQGACYEFEQNLDAAWISYTVALRLEPENPSVNSSCGRIHLKKGTYDSAVVFLSNAAAFDTIDIELLVMLGKAYLGLNQIEAALQYFNYAEQKYPDHPEIYYLIAKIESDQKKHSEAVVSTKKGIQRNPENPELLMLLGQELQFLNQFEEAITAYLSAIKSSKGDLIDTYRIVGNIYYDKLLDKKKAQEFFKKYVKAGGQNDTVNEIIKRLDKI